MNSSIDFRPLKENEVVRLWPTTVMKQMLPGAEQANPLLTERAKKNPNGELNENDGDAAQWLRAHIGYGAKWYLEWVGFKGGDRVRFLARFEVHGFGAYRSLGNQPAAMLSGRYGVTLPKDLEPGPGRDDLHPEYLSFYDPRSAMNMNAIRRDPYLNYHRSIELKPGLLLMWPSYLSFFIHPNLSRTPRVSVAFDIYMGVGRYERRGSGGGVVKLTRQARLHQLPRPPRRGEHAKGVWSPGKRAEYAIRPEAGTRLIWHSAINRFVHPNLSSTEGCR